MNLKINLKDIDTFIFDMDGTLLDNKKNLIDANIEAIQQLKMLGKKIILATGRPIFTLKKYANIIQPNMPLLCANGAMVYSPGNYKNLYNSVINHKDAIKIKDKLNELDLTFFIYSPTHLIGYDADKYGFYKSHSIGVNLEDNIYIEELSNSQLKNIDIAKFLVYFEDNQKSKLKELDRFLHQDFNNIYATISQPDLYDVTNIDANKGNALEKIAQEYNLDLTRAIAFGDSGNDVAMFEKCKYAITHSKANLLAKEKATFITKKDNNQDWIKDFIENNMIK